MEHSYWSGRWRKNKIGFHSGEADDALVQHWEKLGTEQTRVFVPLCGKSLDMVWLAQRGCRVTGVEFVERACREFFAEQNLNPEIETINGAKKYSSGPYEIWCADLMKLPGTVIRECGAVYDRASLVALPTGLREPYVEKIAENLRHGIKYLLVSFEYDQLAMAGPPFSIPQNEIHELYSRWFDVQLVEKTEIIQDLKKFRDRGLESLQKMMYVLTRKS